MVLLDTRTVCTIYSLVILHRRPNDCLQTVVDGVQTIEIDPEGNGKEKKRE